MGSFSCTSASICSPDLAASSDTSARGHAIGQTAAAAAAATAPPTGSPAPSVQAHMDASGTGIIYTQRLVSVIRVALARPQETSPMTQHTRSCQPQVS